MQSYHFIESFHIYYIYHGSYDKEIRLSSWIIWFYFKKIFLLSKDELDMILHFSVTEMLQSSFDTFTVTQKELYRLHNI